VNILQKTVLVGEIRKLTPHLYVRIQVSDVRLLASGKCEELTMRAIPAAGDSRNGMLQALAMADAV
jgi:hypothetical protein